jgi:hypothetical protein
MQVTINVPDNLPPALVRQQISEFEEKLSRLAPNTKEQKQQALMQLIKKCASLPTLDERTPDEILGYDDSPIGLWGEK